MRLMRHGLVGRLPRPANGDHARGAATMLQSAVVPTAAAPNRKPCSSTANAGTMISSAEVRTSGPSAAFSGSCGRCVLMEPSALRWSRRSSRPFSSLQPTSMPAPRRGTKTRQSASNIASSNGIIDISLPIEAKAATVDRGRISDASNACSASSRPASRRWSADVRFRRSIAAARHCRFSSRCCSYMSISFVVPRFDCVGNGTWGMGGAQWKGDDFAILERHDASSGE